MSATSITKAPRRTPGERARDRAQIAELLCQGYSLSQIATDLKHPPNQVSSDYDAIMNEWRNQMLLGAESWKSQDLAKINNLETIYWQEWQKALARVDKSKDEFTGVSRKAASLAALDGVQWCLERRAKLLGLDAPLQIDLEARIRSISIELGLDPDEAVREAQKIVKSVKLVSS